MSLKSSVLSIVEKMEKAVDNKMFDDSMVDLVLSGWACALRAACEAAGDPAPQIQQPLQAASVPYAQDAHIFHLQQVEKAKEEIRRERMKKNLTEEYEMQMFQCVGGSLDGEYIEMPAITPVGAHPSMLKEIYTLREDGKFHFDVELNSSATPG